MNRRELLQGLLAGGTVIAGELIMPSTKLISIPSGKIFTGIDPGSTSVTSWKLVGNTIQYVGPEDKVCSVYDLYQYIEKFLDENPQMESDVLIAGSDSRSVMLKPGFRVDKPEHLIEGMLSQDAPDQSINPGLREQWSCLTNPGSVDEFSDHVFYAPYSEPRARITMLDNGRVGVR